MPQGPSLLLTFKLNEGAEDKFTSCGKWKELKA